MSQYFWRHVDLIKRLIIAFSCYWGWQREIRDQMFCFVKFKCVLCILTLPLLSHTLFISTNSHVSIQGTHWEAFLGIFLSICVFFFELTVSSRKLASLCFYECSLPLRLEKMLFKKSQHDYKSNFNTNPDSKAGCRSSKAKLDAVICEQHIGDEHISAEKYSNSCSWARQRCVWCCTVQQCMAM